MAHRNLTIRTRSIAPKQIEVDYAYEDSPNEHYVCWASGNNDLSVAAAIRAHVAKRAAAGLPAPSGHTLAVDV